MYFCPDSIDNQLASMYVALTVYKDANGLYEDGDLRNVIVDFTIGDRGPISLVDANDIKIKFSKPYMDVTSVRMTGGETLYVSETKDEILAQLSIVSPGHLPIRFTIGDGNLGTPLDGTSILTNASIIGRTIALEKNGVGFLTVGTGAGQYERNDNNPSDGLGDTVTLQGGSVFSTGETYALFIS